MTLNLLAGYESLYIKNQVAPEFNYKLVVYLEDHPTNEDIFEFSIDLTSLCETSEIKVNDWIPPP